MDKAARKAKTKLSKHWKGCRSKAKAELINSGAPEAGLEIILQELTSLISTRYLFYILLIERTTYWNIWIRI